MPMTEDRFFSAWQKIQLRVSTLTDAFNFNLLYPARVVEWESSDIFPSGLVGVVFVSDDVGQAATKLKSKKGIPVLPPVVGQRYVPKVGSQILVGWQGGDERFPYATGWLGLGGAVSVAHDFDTSYTFTGDLVDVVGDLRSQHELGASAGTLSAVVTAPATLNSVEGDDTIFTLSVNCADNMSAFTTATITLGRAFATPPRCVVSATDAKNGGVWTTGLVSAKATGTQTIQVQWNGTALVGSGDFDFTVIVRGT